MTGQTNSLNSSTASLPTEDSSLVDLEIKENQEEKEWRSSGDSGNCSETEEEQNINRATRLEFQLTQHLLSQVRADENYAEVKSGKQAYKDLPRMDFIINGKRIDHDLMVKLYVQYKDLISLHPNHRPFAIQVFTKMFEHVEAKIPNELILAELVTSCNQGGYEGAIYLQIEPVLTKYGLIYRHSNRKTVHIDCHDSGCVDIQCDSLMNISSPDNPENIHEGKNLLKFTVKLYNSKVEYEKGKVTLTIPEELKKYHANGKNLLNDINEHFTDADNSVIESLIGNIGEGPKSFVADPVGNSSEDEGVSFIEILPQECDSLEPREKELSVQSTLAKAQGVLSSVVEFGPQLAKECASTLYEYAQAQYNAVVSSRSTPEENQEDEGIVDQYYEVIIPKTLTFAEVADILNNEIVDDIQDYEDRFMTDLNSENLKKFCSQYLNLDLQGRNDHKYIYDHILSKYKLDAESGNCNYSSGELILLAIAASNKLTEKYQDVLLSKRNKDKDLDQLIIGVCGKAYIKILSNKLINSLNRSVMGYDEVFGVLKTASFTQNTGCMDAVLNLLRSVEPMSRENIDSTPLHFAAQFGNLEIITILLDNKFNVNTVDSNGQTSLYFAVQRSSLEIVELLVGKGANVTEEIVELATKKLKPVGDQQGDRVKIANLLIAQYTINNIEAPTQEPAESNSNLKEGARTESKKAKIEKEVIEIPVETSSDLVNELAIPDQATDRASDKQSQSSKPKSDGSEQLEKNVLAQKGEGSILRRESLSDNCKGDKMHNSDQSIEGIGQALSNAIFSLDYQKVKSLVEQLKQGNDGVGPILSESLKKANETQVGKKDKESMNKIKEIREYLKEKLNNSIAVVPIVANDTARDVDTTISGQETPAIESKENSLPQSSENNAIPSGSSDKKGKISDQPKKPDESGVKVLATNVTPEADMKGDGSKKNPIVINGPDNLGSSNSTEIEEKKQGNTVPEVPVTPTVSTDGGSTKQPNNIHNNNGQPSDQSTQKSKWPTVAISALTVTAFASVAIAFYLEMLAVGIAVAAYCLVAAVAIYCYWPKTSLEDNNVTKVADTPAVS